MTPRLIILVMVECSGLGLLHLLLSRRGRIPIVTFCAAAGGLLAIAGMVLLGPLLAGQARLAPWTAAWIPAFALGFFGAGAVLGLAWLGSVWGIELGLKRLWRRLRRA